MPNRVIREGWLESDKIDCLDPQSERFFLRLCLKADDFGRFHAVEQILRSLLFPLKDDIRNTDISRCLAACEKAGLVRCYEVDGKRYIEIQNFDQRLRAKVSKYPQPSGTCQTHVSQMSDTCRLERKGKETNPKGNESEVETEEEKKGTVVPDALLAVAGFAEAWAAFRKHRQKIRKPMTERAEELILQTLSTRPDHACEAIDLSIRKGWQDVNWDWFDNSKSQKPVTDNNQRTSKFSWH